MMIIIIIIIIIIVIIMIIAIIIIQSTPNNSNLQGKLKKGLSYQNSREYSFTVFTVFTAQ